MTWEELCEKAKEMGYELTTEDYNGFTDTYVDITPELSNKNCSLCFFGDGNIEYCCGGIIAENRTPDQMYAIMEALK